MSSTQIGKLATNRNNIQSIITNLSFLQEEQDTGLINRYFCLGADFLVVTSYLTYGTLFQMAEAGTNGNKQVVLPLIIRANSETYRKYLGPFRIGLGLILSLYFWFKFGFWGWVISVVGIALLLTLIMAALFGRRIEFDGNVLRYRNALGLTKDVPIDQIADVRVYLSYVESTFGVTPRIFITNKLPGKRPISLLSLYWRPEDLDNLLAALHQQGVPVRYSEEGTSAQLLVKESPELFSFMERHYLLSGILIALAILAVIVVGVIWVVG